MYHESELSNLIGMAGKQL